MIAPMESPLVLVGWDFRRTPISIRERLAFTPDSIREALAHITRQGVLSEGVIVSTCNRSEIYGVGTTADVEEAVTEFVAGFHRLPKPDILGSRYGLSGPDAVRHLFRVAAGLESLVLGEDQILAQVREALRVASAAGATRSVLHRLFQQACAAGKRVRSETGVGTRATSIPGVALELARKVYEDIDKRSFLIVGAGDIAAIFYDLLVGRGARTIDVVNRSFDRAQALTSRGGTPRRWDELPARLPHADVVVCATASPTPLFGAAEASAALDARRGRPVLFLDLGVPRNIDEKVSSVENAFLYAVDDLKEMAARNLADREKDIPKAEAILEEELADFLSWYGSLAVVPTVTSLRRRFERVREEEFDRQLSRFERVAPEDREKIRLLAQSMVRSLLRRPTVALKEESDPVRRVERAEAIRHVFGLEDEGGSE
ncbi:MAG TPA: glutamyl-tRNA reductase [Thermoanaerobaculia bacterium]|nr:glutamyl-tRNA reductase [Thermoanaerobaculia bacterium]